MTQDEFQYRVCTGVLHGPLYNYLCYAIRSQDNSRLYLRLYRLIWRRLQEISE